jgi:hypothetical protein
MFVVIAPAAPDEPPPSGSEDLSARLTLRLPDTLKAATERAAEREGLSVNSWVVRALKRSLDQAPPPGRPGKRLWGFTQS